MKYLQTFTFILMISSSQLKCTTSSAVLKNIEDKSNVSKYLVNLLQKYEDFLVVFHVDQATESVVDEIVQHMYNNRTLFAAVIYNHDQRHIAVDFARPKVCNVLHLLFPKDVSYWTRLNSHKRILFHDAIVFVTGDQDLRSQIIDEKWNILKLAGKILVLESKEKAVIHLYEICFYCGNLSKNFRPLAGNAPRDLLNNFHDLNGHLLRLVFIPNFPYLYCSKTGNQMCSRQQMNDCWELNGFEGQMMRVISKKMNFQYRAFVLDINNTFIEMLKLVNSTKADIAFGAISLTLDRRPVIQFSTQFRFEAYTFVYKFSLSIAEIFKNFIEPFQPFLVWILFFAAMVFLSVFLYLVLKLHKHVDRTTLPQSFWVLCHMPLEQSVQNINAVYRGLPTSGLVLTVWWLSCLVFCTMYKSVVLSAMVHPANREPEDLIQLLTAGYRIVGNKQSIDLIKDLLNVDDPMYSQAMQNVEYGINSCDAFAKVFKKRAAMLEEQTMIQYGMRRKCERLDDRVSNQLRIARYPVRFSGHAWAVQHGAPYRDAIDHYLGLVLSGGLFAKWQSDTTGRASGKPIPLSREKRSKRAVSVPVRALYPLFVMYGAGMAVSTVCLVMEILYYAYRFHRHECKQRARMK